MQSISDELRTFFESGITRDLTFRKKQLEALRNNIKNNEANILEALRRDLNKSPFEAYATEIGIVLEEIASALDFGGAGESGMGSYHGEASFNTFLHSKGILKKSNILDVPLRYPPYGNKLSLLKQFLK